MFPVSIFKYQLESAAFFKVVVASTVFFMQPLSVAVVPYPG